MSNSSNIPSQLLLSTFMNCILSQHGFIIFGSYAVTNVVLLLPLCVFILCCGLKKWRKRKNWSCCSSAVSHSEFFTYHLVLLEMFSLLGFFVFLSSIYTKNLKVSTAGMFLSFFTWYGEMYMHVLTCVERYLAVVHPITYRSLKNEKGNRIRNVAVGSVWLLSMGKYAFTVTEPVFSTMNLCVLVLSLVSVVFCSLSVLCALKGGERNRVDQSKVKAFYTILAILFVLTVRFAGNLMWAVMYGLEEKIYCEIMAAAAWFNLPGSLVLPLLFLFREVRRRKAG